MDTSSLIIAICVVIPALIGFIVCGIIFYSKKNKRYQDNHRTNFPNVYRHQQSRRLRTPSPVIESTPPLYDSYPIHQIRTRQLPLFSPVRTTPRIAQVHRDSFVINPSGYSSSPPSYAEIFLTPNTLPDR